MALTKCHECGHDVSTQAKACPTCGAQPKKPSGARFVLFLLAVLGVFGLVSLATRDRSPRDLPPGPPAQAPTPTAPTPTAPDPFTTMTPAEHVAEAKKALDEWKPHEDPMRTIWGRVADAEKHLNTLPAEDQQRPDVLKLKREVDRRNKEIERLSTIAAREVFAKQLERTYLDKGLDVYVSLEGPEKTTLTLKFVLFSRPLVHQFANDANAIAALRKAGFKKVRLTDGYHQAWTLDL
jgi:hypothetical protein